ncbi:MAG: glycine--tRNA ligase subunit beta [Nitrospirae bacterium]|nr:glycine--tRNA ligase subunit beta [Nitrospirota bacterium]
MTQGPASDVVRDLLLEVGTEEIPARFVPLAMREIREEAGLLLNAQGLVFREMKVFGTPRRLVLHILDLAEHQADQVQEILGPPKKVAYDPQGKPTQAALGFAKNQGVGADQLSVKTTEKGEYLCVVKRTSGRGTRELLPELLPELLNRIHFPKSMRWNATQVRFARPIRWILCLYGPGEVRFSFAGVPSGNRSSGHPFLAPGSYPVKDPASYLSESETHFVIPDPEERRRRIQNQLAKEVQSKGGDLVEDEALLDEVTHLVEYPVAVCGSFDESFLQIPREVLITSMRGHQKCFSLEREGKLLPYFIGISNIQSPNMDGIRKGYERVLRARLSDARFFFDTDRKVRLEKRAERLRDVVFLERLGTLRDKTERLIPLTGRICESLQWPEKVAGHAKRAALLCKADLLTEMVGEFPELQGVMGREYAALDGEPPEVAQAIFEHYLPRHAGDRLPESPAGVVLGLADRIVNLVGCFGIGLIPTGSNDPYALRRQALALLNILIAQKRQSSLPALLTAGIEEYGSKISREKSESLRADLLQFIRERGEGLWQSEGYPYDTIRTVLAGGLEDPYTLGLKIKALHTLRQEEDFESLMISFKRAINILQREGMEKGTPAPVQETLLKEGAERDLFRALQKIEFQAIEAIDAARYEEALRTLASLRGPVDQFFEKVLVMDPETVLRENRFRLLGRIQALFNRFGDFSQIVAKPHAL